MKKRIIALCISFILLFSIPVCAAQMQPVNGTAVINTDSLNVRSGPSKDYEKLGTLKKDTMVQIIGRVEPDWYVIEYGGGEGYIHKDYIIVTLQEEEAFKEESAVDKKSILIIGIISAIVIVVGTMGVTLLKSRDEEEDESEEEKGEIIPITSHEDTNMHLGEVSYDTYRIDIDPSFFEDTQIIPQPESIYDDREREQEWKSDIFETKETQTSVGTREEFETLDLKLEEATAQIAALQKEVEKLKKHSE